MHPELKASLRRNFYMIAVVVILLANLVLSIIDLRSTG